jgi:hypothetical protein
MVDEPELSDRLATAMQPISHFYPPTQLRLHNLAQERQRTAQGVMLWRLAREPISAANSQTGSLLGLEATVPWQ